MYLAWGLFFLYGAIMWLWDFIRDIDFRFDGYDKGSKK